MDTGTWKSHSVVSQAAVGDGLGIFDVGKIKSWLVLSHCLFLLREQSLFPPCVDVHL